MIFSDTLYSLSKTQCRRSGQNHLMKKRKLLKILSLRYATLSYAALRCNALCYIVPRTDALSGTALHCAMLIPETEPSDL